MKIVVIAALLCVLAGCVLERVPAVDERGRSWLIECNQNNVADNGDTFPGAECTAIYISPELPIDRKE